MWKETIGFSIDKDLFSGERICDEIYLPPMCSCSWVELACTQACDADHHDNCTKGGAYMRHDQACNIQVKKALPVHVRCRNCKLPSRSCCTMPACLNGGSCRIKQHSANNGMQLILHNTLDVLHVSITKAGCQAPSQGSAHLRPH